MKILKKILAWWKKGEARLGYNAEPSGKRPAPPPMPPKSNWKNVLPEVTANPGPWNNKDNPYKIEIMDNCREEKD